MNLLSLRGRLFLVVFWVLIISLDTNANSLKKNELAKEALQLNNKGVKAYKKGDYLSAIDYTLKSLEIREKIFDKNNTSIAVSCNNLGRLYSIVGNYKKALLYLNKALSIREKSDKTGKHLATVYNNIGIVYQKMGKYPKALEFYEKSLLLRKKIFGINHEKTAIVYSSMGNLYEEIEDYQRALKYYKKDLIISKSKLGKEHIQVAILYNNLGLLYKKMKDFNSSLFYYTKSLKIYEKKLDLNHSYTAINYNNLGLVYMEMKDLDKALKYCKKALKTIHLNYYPARANIYNNIGLIYFRQKHYSLALKYYQKALEIEKKIFSKTHTNIEGSYNNISKVYKAKKDYQNAYKYANLSFDLFITNRDNTFTILDLKEQEKYLKINRDRLISILDTTYKYVISLSFDNRKKILIDILNNWLKFKGTIFENSNILSSIEKNPKTTPKIKKLINDLKQETIKLDNLDNSFEKPKNYKEKKSKIEEQIHNIEVNLSKQSRKFKELLGLKNIDYKQISKALKPNQLYIDFAKGENNYYIFTLDSNNSVTFEKVDKDNIDSNITEFLKINKKIAQNINNHKFIKKLKPKTQKILSNLYKLLITKDINQSELIISPDGYLDFLPFEALFNGKKYLIEDYTIKYISSGRELIRQLKRKDNKKVSKVIVFANPDFWLELPHKSIESSIKGLEDSVTFFDIEELEDLNGTNEIAIIKKHYKDVKVYQYKNATVENLFKIKSPKILHISTHGIYLNSKKIENPMRKTALAFAGANRIIEDDAGGFATALKLSSLDLYGTELVVLSACKTALGEIHQAEGVVGLPKAFIQAGAKRVVMSLWSVSESKTTLLMRYFYDNISDIKDYAMALREAKLKMIDMHPYFWSAFIIYGI